MEQTSELPKIDKNRFPTPDELRKIANSLPSIEKKAEFIETIRGMNLQRATIEDLVPKVFELLRGWPLVQNEIPPNELWFRARKCKPDEYFELNSALVMPKSTDTILGRANLPQNPVLYVSNNLSTVLSEVGAEVGGHYIISRFNRKPEQKCFATCIGELEQIYKSDRGIVYYPQFSQFLKTIYLSQPHQIGLIGLVVDCFLRELFSKRVARDYEYKLTAAIASTILKSVDALIYQSVENTVGRNLALNPNALSNFFLAGAEKYLIKKVIGFGVYELELLAVVTNNENGKLTWELKSEIFYS